MCCPGCATPTRPSVVVGHAPKPIGAGASAAQSLSPSKSSKSPHRSRMIEPSSGKSTKLRRDSPLCPCHRASRRHDGATQPCCESSPERPAPTKSPRACLEESFQSTLGRSSRSSRAARMSVPSVGQRDVLLARRTRACCFRPQRFHWATPAMRPPRRVREPPCWQWPLDRGMLGAVRADSSSTRRDAGGVSGITRYALGLSGE